MASLEKVDEEFSNFMYKVNQVNGIVQKLASSDKKLQEIGDLEAKQYLGDDDKQIQLNEDGEVVLKTTSNRTVLNRKAILKDDNPSTQSQEAFMDELSKDADRRFKDKKMRREKMETLKKQGNLAFRRGELEKALSLYNKAIEYIKDSPLMYQNRALTYINLKFYDKAIGDLDTALKLNETSQKTWFLLIKARFLAGNRENLEETLKEAREKLAGKDSEIQEFLEELNKNADI